MSPRVTAIIVARNGAEHLPRTLEALAAQSMPPDAVIAVDCGSTDATGAMLAEAGLGHVIGADTDTSFGQALALATRVIATPTSPEEVLWLLAQDTAPESGALAALVAALETAPSVAIVGPKQMDWHSPHIIRSFGESITAYGATVPLVADELDQGQHDIMSDVLAVAAGGMLVRHTVWERLDGFDPGLPVVDDALDFCIRARLDGHRVSVAPDARVASAGDGVVGAGRSQAGRARRRRSRARRTAQLHRRLAYAPAAAVPLHWLTLVPLAFLRSILALLGKAPGVILGEFAAAFTVAFSGIRTTTARRRLARTRTLGWAAIAPLRVSPSEMGRRRALAREARIARARGARTEIGFIATGGAWTLIAAIVVGIIVVAPLVGATAVHGGGLLPLDSSPAALWRNIGYGWRDIGTGFVGAADPFAAVLALIGSLAFWAPPVALLALWFAAVPLAALGAWFAATRITERGGLRALAAIIWMIAPPLTSAIADGRPASVIVHILLPWLVFVGFQAARTWSASATTALLLAAVVACAPILTPALAIIWVVVLLTSGRRFFRIVGIPIPAIVLLVPLAVDQFGRGIPFALAADPGLPLPGIGSQVTSLVLGLPGAQDAGWSAVLRSLSIDGVDAALVVPILLAPLAILAILAMFLRGSRTAFASIGIALLGLASAVASTTLLVATLGAQSIPLWAGAGLSLYWLGIVGAAVAALNAIPRFAMLPAVLATVAAVLAVAPLALALPLGTASVEAGNGRTVPAFVEAEAKSDPRAGTLIITAQPDGGILADLQRGSGTTLDDQSTLAATVRVMSPSASSLAELAANLSSRSGLDSAGALDEQRIRFVLLAPSAREPGTDASAAATQTQRRAAAALDGNDVLVPVGATDFGRLWRVDTELEGAATAAVPASAGGWLHPATLITWAIVFGIALLLSIPTGAGREVDSPRRRPAIATGAAEPADAEAESETSDPESDAEPDAEPEPEPDSAAEPAPSSDIDSTREDDSPPDDTAGPESEAEDGSDIDEAQTPQDGGPDDGR